MTDFKKLLIFVRDLEDNRCTTYFKFYLGTNLTKIFSYVPSTILLRTMIQQFHSKYK